MFLHTCFPNASLLTFAGEDHIFDFLISNGANTRINQDDNGLTLLDWAAYGGNIEIFKKMLGNGHDINKRDANQRTVLHYAVMSKNEKMVDYIISKNISPLLADDKNRTPLDYAKQLKTLEIIKKLEDAEKKAKVLSH